MPRQIRARVVGADMLSTSDASTGFAGADRDQAVELQVGREEFLDRRVHVDRFQHLAELDAVLVGHASRRQRGRSRFEDAAHLQEVEHRVVAMEVDDEAQRLEQQRRREAGRVRAVALAHVEHVDQRQCPDGLALRVSGQAEFGGQVRLARKPLPRAYPPRNDHVFDREDRLVGQCHCFPSGRLSIR